MENEIVKKDKVDDLVTKIIEEDDPNKTKDMIELFNWNMTQKSVARAAKLNGLLDKVTDQAIERFDRRPDEVSNKDLLSYMSIVNDQLNKTSENLKSLDATPIIKIDNTKVNIDMGKTSIESLPKSSRDKMLKAIEALRDYVTTPDDNIIDVEVVDKQEKK